MRFTAPARRVDKVAFGKPTHYYVDAKGDRIPGVTTILSEGINKPALINWAANTTADYAVNRWDELGGLEVSERLKRLKKARYEDLDQASRRGTEVHALAEELVHGREIRVPDELRGHVESYTQFLDDWEPKALLTEVTVINYSVGYAGTLDLIFELPDGKKILADVKTSRSGIYGEVALQLAAYRHAEVYLDPKGGERPMPQVDECYALWIRADGYSVIPMQTDQAVFDDFRRVMQVVRVAERLPSYKGEELQVAHV